jgi:transcriptional regulator with XRE-family HTH domain
MSRVERGLANPSLDAVEKLAKALDVEPWVLLQEHPTNEPDH